MFWKYNNGSSSPIENKISKGDITLKELLNVEDIINECKLQNKALIDFLLKPENLEELITLATVEPPAELEERTRYKYSYIACQILVCDIPTINEGLASNESLLSKLYEFLDCDPPLNPLLASYFSEIMCVLITKKTEQNWLSHQVTCLQVIDFLKKKENFVLLLLKHLGTSAIMDLTLKLMTQVKGAELRQNVMQWLNSQNLVQSLVSLLDPSVDKERHYNVAQLLCDFIKTARENQRNYVERYEHDVLLNTLESSETITLLLDHMLSNTKVESCIVGGIQVLLALLEFSNPLGTIEESSDVEKKKGIIEMLISPVLKRLKDFHDLLLNPPKKVPIGTSVGIIEVPVGNTRLRVTKLLATFIATNSPEIIKELMALGTFQLLLDLFFQYPWNNFLHTQVEACITAALSAPVTNETGDDNALYSHLIVQCRLVERILEAWKDNEEKQSQTNGLRQGYMGHLTNIANTVASHCSSSSLGEFLNTTVPEVAESFDKFVESTLQEINNKRDTLLGGVNASSVTNEVVDEFGNLPLSQTALLQQQVYAQYQLQDIAPMFIETYRCNDDNFDDDVDTLRTIGQRTNINFDLSEGDLVQQHEFFKQICAQNINTLDDADDQIFEEKDHTFQTVIEKKTGDDTGLGGFHSSSDSEDDSPPPDDPFMDVDMWSPSNYKLNESEMVSPISTEDPWNRSDKAPEEASSTAVGNNDWADFGSATFVTAFDSNFQVLPNRTEQEIKSRNDSVKPESRSFREVAETEVGQIMDQAVEEVAKKLVAGGDGIDQQNVEGKTKEKVNEQKTSPSVEEEQDKKNV